MKIRLAIPHIQKDSIVDGEGIRGVIWTQGCPHNCLGCHNPETHDFDSGELVEIEELFDEIDNLDGHDGITFSGGDPMIQPKECAKIAKHCHKKGFNVWCYTGYTYEKLLDMSETLPAIFDFLKQIDVLVDGKFILGEKSFDVIFRGSKNQRLINVPESLKSNSVVLITKYDNEVTNSKKGRKNHYMFV